MNLLTDIIDREVARYQKATHWAQRYIDSFDPDYCGTFDELVESFYADILANEDMA